MAQGTRKAFDRWPAVGEITPAKHLKLNPGRPVADICKDNMAPPETRLYVVIPAYNEQAVVGDVVAAVRRSWPLVIVVDDGSTDATARVALRAGAEVLRHAVNLGQGAALQTGLEFALQRGATHICTFDADGQHNVGDIEVLVAKLQGDGLDIVLGSRALGRSVAIPPMRRVMLRAATAFTRRHTGLAVTDAHNGLRLMTAGAAERIRLTQPGMAHASELLYLVGKQDLRWAEAPVTITYSPYSLRKGQSLFNFVKIMLDLSLRRMVEVS